MRMRIKGIIVGKYRREDDDIIIILVECTRLLRVDLSIRL